MSPRPDIYVCSSQDSIENINKVKSLGAVFIYPTSPEMQDVLHSQNDKVVVIIDDDGDFAETTAAYFLYFGASAVHIFTNPLMALKQLEDLNPDTVITDLEMPELSGFAVLDAIGKMDFEK